MRRFTIPALAVAVVAGGAWLAPLSAQTYNDFPNNTNRNYGSQQNQGDYNNANRPGTYGQQRPAQDNYGQNSNGQNSYGQDRYTYGQQRSYGQDNYGQTNRGYGQDSYNRTNPRNGYGRNDDSDRSNRSQQPYGYQGNNRYNGQQYNGGQYNGGQSGVGRNPAPSYGNRYNPNDND